MSTTYEPRFFRGPRLAVYLALGVASAALITVPELDHAHRSLILAEAEHLGIPVDAIDGRTVIFLSGSKDTAD